MRRTIVLLVLDGWGIGAHDKTNPIFIAEPPNINYLRANYRAGTLQASGIAVGLPWGEEGNSEVGHLTIGAGKVIYQHYPRISIAIRNRSFFKNAPLKAAFDLALKNQTAVNCIGLLTAGNVHASMEHVEALIQYARLAGVKKLNIHPVLDGKDSPRRSAGALVKKLQTIIEREKIGGVGSIGGRYYGLDRDLHLDRTKKMFDAITGASATRASSIDAWLQKNYANKLEDEFIEPAIVDPSHVMQKNDSVIFWDFREDSIRQLAEMSQNAGFSITTFTEYAEKLKAAVAFPEERVEASLGKTLADHGKLQLRIAETEKYAHVTYFFNGLEETPNKNEYRVLIPSQNVARHDEHPETRAAEISARVVQSIQENGADFILANLANADMIAHTGNFDATRAAIGAVDRAVRRIYDACRAGDAILIMTADHGNAEQLVDPLTGVPETRHNPSPVPCYLIAKEFISVKNNLDAAKTEEVAVGTLADIAPTILELMNIPIPESMTGTSLVNLLH